MTLARIRRVTARVVNYGVEATELVGLVGNGFCSGYGREIPGDNPPSSSCCRERITAPPVISPVQDDIVASINQEFGCHQTQAVR